MCTYSFQVGPTWSKQKQKLLPKILFQTKRGAKVKNKGAGVPYPHSTVCEGVRREVTHEGMPTMSECAMATGYDP
jgi:hypothetical protein